MSRVYFESPSDSAEILGRERAYMGVFCGDLASGLLPLRTMKDERLRSMLPSDHYLRSARYASGPRWESGYRLAYSVGDSTMEWRGHTVDTFALTLNTVMVVGNDVTRLFARLHGQCEIHAWVDGPNRAWLAGLISEGLETSLLRRGVKWESVVEMLRRREDEPVALSDSSADPFPSAEASDWMPSWPEGVGKTRDWRSLTEEQQREREERAEAWDSLPGNEQWERAEAWLRTENAGLEMKPDNWASYRFGHCLSLLDIDAEDYAERLDRAFA